MDFLYDAFGWVLGQLYNLVNNYFVAIALFALIVKLALLPSSIKQQKSSAKQSRLQPKLRRIQERYKGDKNAQQKIQEEQQALYQREGFNPMNQGCLPMLIQLPIIWGLYGAVYKPLTYAARIPKEALDILTELANNLGKEAETTSKASRMIEITVIDHIREIWDAAISKGVDVSVLEQIETFGTEEFNFLGYSLGANPTFVPFTLLTLIPILSFVTSIATSLISYVRSKRTNPAAAKSMGCMTFGMPLLSLWFVTMFPAAIGIYWIINNVYSFIQTFVVGHFYSPEKVIARTMVEETIYRRSKENNMKIMAERKKNEEK